MGLKSIHLLHFGTPIPVIDSIQLGSIEQFCKAAELGSFTAAAEVFGVTPAAVSRSVSRLERRLGVRLFSRTTRSVKVTSDGELFWKECRLALEQIAEAERAITGAQAVPKGLLRISVGAADGTHRLLPLMPQFAAAYPQIEIELSISDHHVQRRMRVLNDALGCVAWLDAGGGLYQTYRFAATAAVQCGDLVEVLQSHAGPSRPFSILYPQNRHLSAKARAFIDFLRSTLSVQPVR